VAVRGAQTGEREPTARGSGSRTGNGGRRAQLLELAIDLFARHGYEAVGVDDIGAAAGVSGPALYRHFSGKPALLVAAYEHVWERMRDELDQALAEHTDPTATLSALVDSWVAIAAEDRALIAVYVREERGLPEHDRRRLRRYQRGYIAAWSRQLRALRPELDEQEADAAVRCAIAAINSVAFYEGGLPEPRLSAMLREAAWAVLTQAASGSGA